VAVISKPQILDAATFWKWVCPTQEGFWRDANVWIHPRAFCQLHWSYFWRTGPVL